MQSRRIITFGYRLPECLIAHIFSRLLNCLGFLLLFSVSQAQEIDAIQDSVAIPDTIYVNDTIYETRSIEKVVYIYHTPKHYLSTGLTVYAEMPQYTRIDGYRQEAICAGGGVSLQYSRGSFIADIGVGVRNYSRRLGRIYQSPHYKPTTYIHSDTLSYYDVTLNNVTTRKYIIKQSERDTVLVNYTDSAVKYRSTHQYICLPLMAGVQRNFGFLSVDAKLGLVPNVLLHTGGGNTAVLADGTAVPEDGHMRKLGCDAATSVSLRYLLTVKTLICADVLYSRSFIPLTKSGAARLSRQGFALQIGVSYLFCEFE